MQLFKKVFQGHLKGKLTRNTTPSFRGLLFKRRPQLAMEPRTAGGIDFFGGFAVVQGQYARRAYPARALDSVVNGTLKIRGYLFPREQVSFISSLRCCEPPLNSKLRDFCQIMSCNLTDQHC